MDFFRNWLKMALKKGSPTAQGRVQQNRRLILECLEGRETPAAVNFSGTPYTQDFQSMTGTSTATAASLTGGGTMVEISSLGGGGPSGWYTYMTSATGSRWFSSDTGSSNSGGFRQLIDTTSSGVGRAFGSQGSGSAAGFYGIVLKNTSGSTINSLNISFDAVMNRNPSTTANPTTVSYRISTTDVVTTTGSSGAGTFADAAGTWNTFSTDLSFTSPSSSTGAPGTQAAINPLFKITTKSVSSQSVSWANNSFLYIRYSETDDSGSDSTQGVDNFSISLATPTITGAATATAFTTTYGTASAAQSFSISGSNLTANLVATAPTGFEVSSDGTTYGSTATFTQSSGSASGTLRIRLAANAAVGGSYNSQNIVLSSTGATSVNITTAATGNSVTAKALTITGLTANNKDYDGNTNVTVTGTPAYSGLVNGDSFSVTGTVTWAFPDDNVGNNKTLTRTGSYDTPSSNYTVTQPTLTASINAVLPTAPTINSITPGNQQLSVAFSAPSSNGGASITDYKYSLDGGSFVSVGSTSSPFTITGLTNGQTYSVRILAVNSAGDGAASAAVNGTPAAPVSPTVTVSGLSGSLSTTYGTASTEQSFTVSGSALTGNLTIAAPTGLEVSTTSGSGFADSLQLTATAGTVANTTIYVRIKATAAAGSYNSVSINITGGGDDKTVSTGSSGNSVAAKGLTITGISIADKVYDQGTTASITGTAAYSGLVNGESFSVTGSPTASFADKNVGTGKSVTVSGYTAPSSNYSITQPTGLTANITAASLTVTGAAATNRAYDATTTVAITGGTLSGVIAGDTVTLGGTPTGSVATAAVGTGKSVTVTGYSISGTDSGNYTLSQPTGLTVDITKANQTITFNTLPNKQVGDANFNLTATSSSGLTVSYASSNTSVATISGSTVTIVGIGSTTITASQAGDDNYNAASSVNQTLTVTAGPTTLAAGDVGVIGYNTAGSPDSFTILVLKDLNAGTIFYVNDNETASGGTSFNDLAEVEASFSVKSGKTITAGTVITLPWGGAAVSDTTVGYDWSSTSGAGFGNNNDEIFIYTASSITATTPTAFIYGVAIGSSTQAAPSGLTAGSTFINPQTGAASRYKTSGATYSGTAAQLRTAIGTTGSNWEGTAPASSSDWTFTVLKISGAATAAAFTTTYGTASAAQSFSVSGSDLTADLIATAPTGFEVSSDGTTYGSTATFTQSSGSASGTLRIRLAANAAVSGSYNSQNIVLSSTGTTSVNITTAASGNSVTAKALTITGLTANNKDYDGNTNVTVTGTPAYSGLVNGDSFSVTGTVTWAFPDANAGNNKTLTRTGSYDTPSSNYTLTQPTLTASINALVPTAPTINSITPGNQQLSVAFSAPSSNGGASITDYKYSLDGGSFVSVGSTSSPFTITGLTNGQTYSVRILAVNSAGDGAASTAVDGTPAAPVSPTVTVSGLSGSLSTTYGTASTEQSFTVSGSALTGNLTVAAPTGLEVSTTSGSGFADSLLLTATSGTVANTTIYVRIKATAPAGSYNSVSINITGGGDDKTVSTGSSGNSVAAKGLTITGISISDKVYDQGTTASITGTAAYSGLVNGESFSVTGSPTASFADKNVGTGKSVTVSGYTAPSSNYSITQPTGLTATITVASLTVTGAAATNRAYDATTTVAITGGTLSGVIAGDTVTLGGTPTGSVATAAVGTGKSVTVTGYSISGTDSGNYTLSQPTGLTVDITKANQTITFGALPTKTTNDSSFTLGATATSGLTITYTSSNTSVATVSGNTVTIVGVGSTTITASQAGDDNYNAATDVAQNLTVTRALAAGDLAFIQYDADNPDKFSFVNLVDLEAGMVINFTDNGFASATTGSTLEGFLSFTVPAATTYTKGTTFTWTNGMTITGTPWSSNSPTSFAFNASGDQLFAFQGSTSNWATQSGINLVAGLIQRTTWLTTGTPTASQSYQPSGLSTSFIVNLGVENGYFANGTSTTSSVTVSDTKPNLQSLFNDGTNKWFTNATGPLTAPSYSISVLQTQTINFNSLSNKTYGDANFDLTATASSGLTVTYVSSDTSVATISGSTVTILKAGTTTITASQAGDSTYAAATPVQQSLTINTKALTVTGAAVTSKPYDNTNAAVITGTLSGVVGADAVTLVGTGTFASVNAGSGISVTSTSTLSGAAASNYTLTQPTGLTGTITKVDQNITWPTPTPISLGTAISTTQLNASVSGVSGGSAAGSLTYDTLIGTVLPTGANSMTVTAAGTSNYNQTTKTVTVQVNAYYADPNPSTGNGFGTAIVTLTNGNVVITAPLDDFGGTDAGAVYLYSGATGALISTLVGSHTNDKIGSDGVLALSNGNFVVRSSFWDNGTATDAGAVTFGSAVTGVSGTVSSTNSLVGSTTDDHVGKYVITALKNGNYVVPSLDWDNGGFTDAGAVTFGSGTSGISGVISSSNSLVGSHNNDKIGSVGITELSNGNYVARSDQWDDAKGAVTWGNGLTGTSGTVDATNSIVGSTANDLVGGGSVGILGNGNLVFTSPHWHNSGATDSGAATWLNGTNGKTIENAFGAVSASNSLVGSSGRSGDAVGLGGVTVLKNNNYVVVSANWNNVRGAATWGDGSLAVVGVVSDTNSLVGDVDGANVGSGGVTGLANSNYLVNSMNWSTNKGAVTFGNGLTGKTGTISSSTSLVGTVDNSYVGYSGVTELSQGNFVVGSSKWNNGTSSSVGAATFGSGTSGITGVVSSSNSLVGSQANDQVGSKVTALKNGNYAVVSSTWANGTSSNAGAVTFGNGTSGVSGTVSASNSLVGSSADDQLGSGGIKELSNGNFLVASPLWNNNTTADAGAVTWVNGTNGLAGSLSSSNSLVGTQTNDKVGGTSITVIPNGNYVVASSNWDNGTTVDAGAVTWGNGSTGTSGNVGSGNSFVGTSANDQVGSGGVTVLSNNHFVVSSPNWNNGTISLAGAVTWGDGSTGGSGAVSSTNSLVGTTANDQIGSGGVTALTGNGNYVIASPLWDAGATADVGAVTFVNGANGSTVGGLTSSNSLVGTTAGDMVGDGGVTALASGNYLVKSSLWNNGGSLAKAGAVTLGLGTSGISGSISSSNSTVGSVADAGLQAVTLNLGNSGYLVRFLNDGASSRVSFGYQNPTSAVFTSANNTTFTVGAAGSFTFTATGSPKPAFSLVSGNLPSGVTLNSVTGVLSGTPGAGSAGTYNLTIRATNGLGTVTDLAFTLTVA